MKTLAPALQALLDGNLLDTLAKLGERQSVIHWFVGSLGHSSLLLRER